MGAPLFIADPEELRTIELEGLTLLFDPRSGMTHILAPPAPQILSALAIAGTVDTLLARLSGGYEFDEIDGPAAVAARLAELEAAGLVRRA